MAVAKNGKVHGPATVITPAGLEVPASAADQAVEDGTIAAAMDGDGRRRVVLTRQDQKAMNAAILMLKAADLGMVVCCRRCDQAMVPEAMGTPDAGYGCSCSRVHFRDAVLVTAGAS